MSKCGTVSRYLPKQEELSAYWQSFFQKVDAVNKENFWGNLSTFREAEALGDAYITQMKDMGYCFDLGKERIASFYDCLSWVYSSIEELLEKGELGESDTILPAKVYESLDQDGGKRYHFIPIGCEKPERSEEVNLLPPNVFVEMLSEGYFPLGEAEREHTNQSMAEHDLAHMAGFISNPCYMRAIREAFRRVRKKSESCAEINLALESFNSLYSLRLYYMTEVFTEVADRDLLEDLLGFSLSTQADIDFVHGVLRSKYEQGTHVLFRYMERLCTSFFRLINPLGGESRDIINRVRKFNRGNTLGTFYQESETLRSKFNGNSIYSLYYNALAALKYKRSNHSDFDEVIEKIFAPFVLALLGTSQLSVEDWVLQVVEELPDKDSKLYHYIHDSGAWSVQHAFHRVHCASEFSEEVLL